MRQIEQWFRDDGTVERARLPEELTEATKSEVCRLAASNWNKFKAILSVEEFLKLNNLEKFL